MLLKIEINLYARNVGNPQDGLAAFLPKRLPTCQNGSPGKALLECRYLALYIIILAYNEIRRCTNRKGISLRISNDHQACLCGVALSFNARAGCNKFSYWKSRFPASEADCRTWRFFAIFRFSPRWGCSQLIRGALRVCLKYTFSVLGEIGPFWWRDCGRSLLRDSVSRKSGDKSRGDFVEQVYKYLWLLYGEEKRKIVRNKKQCTYTKETDRKQELHG